MTKGPTWCFVKRTKHDDGEIRVTDIEEEGASLGSGIDSETIRRAYGEIVSIQNHPKEFPLQVLPPVLASEWIVHRVVDLSKRMGVKFNGIEYKVVELFHKIGCRSGLNRSRRTVTPRSCSQAKKSRELKSLASSINYEWPVESKIHSLSRSRGRMGKEAEDEGNKHIVNHEDTNNNLEY